ncbi:MAG: DUF3307 domain-containing protein [Paracoccaceae bacterium]
MTHTVLLVLFLLFLFQIKHMFADFFLQTQRMLTDRAEYIHFGRFQHVVIHALGSAIVFLAIMTGPGFILVTVIIEAVVHYHIDWAKGWYSSAANQTPMDAGYWRAMGVDQALHQITYVAMALAWVYFAAG